eukprot:s753_g6.t1
MPTAAALCADGKCDDQLVVPKGAKWTELATRFASVEGTISDDVALPAILEAELGLISQKQLDLAEVFKGALLERLGSQILTWKKLLGFCVFKADEQIDFQAPRLPRRGSSEIDATCRASNCSGLLGLDVPVSEFFKKSCLPDGLAHVLLEIKQVRKLYFHEGDAGDVEVHCAALGPGSISPFDLCHLAPVAPASFMVIKLVTKIGQQVAQPNFWKELLGSKKKPAEMKAKQPEYLQRLLTLQADILKAHKAKGRDEKCDAKTLRRGVII